MPFCTECGAKLEEGAKFCTNCGARQPELSPAPGAPVETPSQSAPQQTSYQYDPTIYSPSDTKKKKSGGKFVFLILAVLAVLAAVAYVVFSRTGSASAPAADPADLGLYSAVKAEYGGAEIAVSDLWEDGISIELKDKGRCEVNVEGEKGSAKWELSDGRFTVKGSGLDCSGTLADGVLILDDVMESGVKLFFTKNGAALPEKESAPVVTPALPESTPAPEEPVDAPQAILSGHYYAVKAESFGMVIDVSTMWEEGFSIDFADNGVCTLTVNGSSAKANWTLDGDKIAVSMIGLDLNGHIEDNSVIFEDVYGTGLTLFLVKEGTELPVEEPQAQITNDEYSWWNGDWYGWWVAYASGGSYADYESSAWDVCGRIERTGANSGRLRLWDEDMDVEFIADVDFRLEDGLSDKGRLVSNSGRFYNYYFADGEWIVDPADAACGGFDDLIAINGIYLAADSEENWIEYYFFLRPWGTRWEDIEQGDTSGMLYPNNMMPLNYSEWYLPLIEAGQGMPDAFEGLQR